MGFHKADRDIAASRASLVRLVKLKVRTKLAECSQWERISCRHDIEPSSAFSRVKNGPMGQQMCRLGPRLGRYALA